MFEVNVPRKGMVFKTIMFVHKRMLREEAGLMYHNVTEILGHDLEPVVTGYKRLHMEPILDHEIKLNRDGSSRSRNHIQRLHFDIIGCLGVGNGHWH